MTQEFKKALEVMKKEAAETGYAQLNLQPFNVNLRSTRSTVYLWYRRHGIPMHVSSHGSLLILADEAHYQDMRHENLGTVSEKASEINEMLQMFEMSEETMLNIPYKDTGYSSAKALYVRAWTAIRTMNIESKIMVHINGDNVYLTKKAYDMPFLGSVKKVLCHPNVKYFYAGDKVEFEITAISDYLNHKVSMITTGDDGSIRVYII